MVLLTGVHEEKFDLPSETLHIVQLLQAPMVVVVPGRGAIRLMHVIQVTGLLHVYN